MSLGLFLELDFDETIVERGSRLLRCAAEFGFTLCYCTVAILFIIMNIPLSKLGPNSTYLNSTEVSFLSHFSQSQRKNSEISP
jgi:hypothetical protein